jgi:Xaa-Pro aminopeptidase
MRGWRQRPWLGDFAPGQFRTEYEERPDPAALRAQRLQRAQQVMVSQGLDALLCWKDENVRYLTGLRAQIIAGKSALLNGCLLFPEGSPILLASGGEVQRAHMAMPWIEEIHSVPIMEAAGLVGEVVRRTILPILQRRGVASGTVGLDECGYALFAALHEQSQGLRISDGDAVMQVARRIKFPEEISLMQEASAIAEAVTQSAIDAIRPGVRETDVVAEAMHTLFRLGGEYAHVMTPFVASGEHMSPPNRISSDKIIRSGDIVFIDIGAQWSGYFSDMGRTVACGSPSRRQAEIYSAVHESLIAATANLAVGRTNDDVASAVRDVAGRHGLAGNLISLFIGHGVGMGSNEPPYIGESLPGAETVALEPGMVFAVEPLIWVEGIRGGGGVRLEDTILVTEHGGQPLTRLGWDEQLLLG